MSVSPELLRNLIPLTNLNAEALNQLASKGHMFHLKHGQQIYAQGSEDGNIYYLIEGRIRMTDRHGKAAYLSSESEQSHYAFGKLKPRPSDATVDSERAKVLCFDGGQLETLLSWHQQLAPYEDSDPQFSELSTSLLSSELEVDEVEVTYNEWVLSLLRCQTFYNVPPENVQQLAEKMEPVNYRAGDIVIHEGDPGENYYIIREGECRVLRGGTEIGRLGPLDAFGEEALISGAPRNATVEMVTDGLLMRLSQKVFLETLVPPLIKRVSLKEVKAMALRGAILIDVRTRREFKRQRLVRSINLPLYILRAKLKKLSHKKTYIVYCDSGKRSSAATFLLSQEGFEAYLLDDPQRAFEVMTAPPQPEKAEPRERPGKENAG